MGVDETQNKRSVNDMGEKGQKRSEKKNLSWKRSMQKLLKMEIMTKRHWKPRFS